MKKYIVSERQINELMEKLVGTTKMDLPIGKLYSMGKSVNEKSFNDDMILPKQSGMEQETQYYMFFQNIQQIHKQTGRLLQMSKSEIDSILQDGHDWAADHISTAKDDVEEVYNFLTTSKTEVLDDSVENMEVTEGIELQEKNVPTNPKLWKKSLSWAKSRYKVCPSAYCNGAAAKHYKSLGGKWKTKK